MLRPLFHCLRIFFHAIRYLDLPITSRLSINDDGCFYTIIYQNSIIVRLPDDCLLRINRALDNSVQQILRVPSNKFQPKNHEISTF